jgi:hypothetical protein
MTMSAETEAAKAASIPASPGLSRDASQDDCVAYEAGGSEAGALSILIIASTTIGVHSTPLPLDLDAYWALQFERLAAQ